MANPRRKAHKPDVPEDAPEWHKHDWSTQEVDFVSEYIRTGDEGRAYRYAFKLVRSESETQWMLAGTKGRALLDKPWMNDYVSELQRKLREKMTVNSTTILEELAKLGYANMADFVVLNENGIPQFDLSGLTHAQSAAISEMTIDTYVEGRGEAAREIKSIKLKLSPKIGALELLGKNLKMWTDVVRNEGDADLAEEIRAARARKRERTDDADDRDRDGEVQPGGEGGADPE